MDQGPRYSFIIPTRDRPDFIQQSIPTILAQDFTDLEIVIHDNPSPGGNGRDCRDIVNRLNDGRIRYYLAPKPLNICDNWECAIRHARGQYVTVAFDKFLFCRDALAKIENITALYGDPDIISWPWATYYPIGDDTFGPGTVESRFPPSRPQPFSPLAEMRRRLAFRTRRGQIGDPFHRGKIDFGFWHRRLVQRILNASLKIFFPFFPDYTSLAQALVLAETAVDLNEPIWLMMQPKTSTGIGLDFIPSGVRSYLSLYGKLDTILETLPIPGVDISQHNVVARDYLFAIHSAIKGRAGHFNPRLNRRNLYRCIYTDLIQARHEAEDRVSAQLLFLQLFAGTNILPVEEKVSPLTRIRYKVSRSFSVANGLLFLPNDFRKVLVRPGCKVYGSPAAGLNGFEGYYTRNRIKGKLRQYFFGSI